MSATSPIPDLRPARASDSPGILALVESCWLEYPGIIFDPSEIPDTASAASAYPAKGGGFWVAESSGRIVGSVGVIRAADSRGMELRALYVARDHRRRGLGARLVGLVEDDARRRGAAFVHLWSDARFTDAHRLYERLGYVRGHSTRALHDLSRSVELEYRKDLAR